MDTNGILDNLDATIVLYELAVKVFDRAEAVASELEWVRQVSQTVLDTTGRKRLASMIRTAWTTSIAD